MKSTPDKQLASLCLAAVGVVFGDIGTSPLYTTKEVFSPENGMPLTDANIIGVVSTIFWALMMVVTLKYVVLVMRADNRGEGGIMALLAMALSGVHSRKRQLALIAIGTFGCTLFYGDSIITPSISVLSAVEGLELAAPALEPFVLPITIAVLIALFLVQRQGTAVVGRLFGPILALWFAVLGGIGFWRILDAPQVLAALNPLNALSFMLDRGPGIFVVVGSIVLALTGAEALYADMGHFGRKAVRIAWSGLVLPGLALNYLGQGATLLTNADAFANPFYYTFPPSLLYPAIVLSTLATIIASQSVITGAYSLTQQAIHLGMLPRLQTVHTSSSASGQIYMPAVNWLLLLAVIIACLSFGNSSDLAGAYGIAVTGTMLCTTLLTFVVVRHKWHYPLWLALLATGLFFVVDLLLLASTSLKFLQGGWFPVVLGLSLFITMWTWKDGRELLNKRINEEDPDLMDFVWNLDNSPFPKVPRTAVYLVSNPAKVPRALLHNLKHNLTLHEKNLVVTVKFADVPYLETEQRVQVDEIGQGFWRVTLTFGFMERPDVPEALPLCNAKGLKFDLYTSSFFVSRETLIPSSNHGLSKWREQLFIALSRNAGSVVNYFNLPSNHVIELGARVNL
ncbi:MAG: potassium transporter Kup [Pseudomonadales bacterium]|jgi:KUP system potassium uptake protein|nr:potassium transporter Kup [Pseudomonadales bacterium]